MLNSNPVPWHNFPRENLPWSNFRYQPKETFTRASSFTPSLPAELWIYIFRHATSIPRDYAPYALTYSPFQRYDHDAETIFKAALRLRCVLVLVCKQWYRLAKERLYEDVYISPLLSIALDASRLQGDNRRAWWGQRITVPYTYRSCDNAQPSFVAALAQFTQVSIMVRPRPSRRNGHSYAPMPPAQEMAGPLRSLRRIDWFNDRTDENNGCNTLSCLSSVLSYTTRLQYLSLLGSTSHILGENVNLPELRTLRLKEMDETLLQIIAKWYLPALEHVAIDAPAVDSPATDLHVIWASVGAKVKIVELGCHPRFLADDFIQVVLDGCPKLEELNFYVQHTLAVIPYDQIPHPSLRLVRMYADNWSAYEGPEGGLYASREGSQSRALYNRAFASIVRFAGLVISAPQQGCLQMCGWGWQNVDVDELRELIQECLQRDGGNENKEKVDGDDEK